MKKIATHQKINQEKVICIGSISLDIFFPTKEGIVLNTPEDVLAQKKIAFELGAKYRIIERYEVPGGCASNVSHGLTRLGMMASACGVVGHDAAGLYIREMMNKWKISTKNIQVLEGKKTDLAMIIVDEKSGDRTIFLNRSVNEHLKIQESMIGQVGWVFVSALYGDWKRHLATSLMLKKGLKAKLVYNPGQANIHEDVDRVIAAIGESSVVFLNLDEAREIGSKLSQKKTKEVAELIKQIKSLGPEVVAITDGINGAWGYDGKRIIKARTMKVKAKDSTGAGDAFSSGFLAAYIQGHSLSECIQWGVVNGASVVQYYGAHDGLLSQGQIKDEARLVHCEEQ